MAASIDISLYWRQKQPSIDWFYGNGRKDVDYTIGCLPGYTMVPCIVLAVWLLEECGPTPQLIKKTKKLIDFYGYSEILGVHDSFPEELKLYLRKD